MCSHEQEHTRYQGVVSIPNHLEAVAMKLSHLQPRQNEERAGLPGCLQGFHSALSGCLLEGKSDVGAKMLRMPGDGEEREQEAACVQGEEKDSLPETAFRLVPRKAAVRCFSRGCLAFSLLLLTQMTDPYLFPLLAWYFISSILPILVCWDEQICG